MPFCITPATSDASCFGDYLRNIAMSLMYLSMLRKRRSDKGQSLLIAVCKCIGTLTPTIYGALEGNWFILTTGILCFVFDVIYIIALKKTKAANP